MASSRSKYWAGYAAVAAVSCALAIGIGSTQLAQRINNYAYDIMTRSQPAPVWTPRSVVVAIDDATLSARGGTREFRSILAGALETMAAAQPKAVAIDMILHDVEDPALDMRLEAALRATRNVVLDCELTTAGGSLRWEDPEPRFRDLAVALGHVTFDTLSPDGINRMIPLEMVAADSHRWALSLEAFGVSRGQPIPIESPDDLEIGGETIPAAKRSEGRPMFIRYLPAGIPTISVMELSERLDEIRGKTVFLGVTALSAAHDRLKNSYGQEVSGVEVHAQAFETMERGSFLIPSADSTVLLVCAALAIAAALDFALLSGWAAYAVALALLAIAHWTPVWFFRQNIVFLYFYPVATAWLAITMAASYQHFFVRRQLRRSESEKSRYQQAIHFVAHEMRSPLTAIQGSSEIMTRYALPEQKQKQLSEMINSESKRLARMIQTFLDVERLSDGQMELKREAFSIRQVIETCVNRAKPLAERKSIALEIDSLEDATIEGDRELLEYAFYNLLTNAVKYSPAKTETHVRTTLRDGELRISVRDQGIGMDAKEIKKIFQKFYRTKRAEASGEVGTGIGLSIVEQIVMHHGGRMEVESTPQRGSCFTMVMNAKLAVSPDAQTADRRG